MMRERYESLPVTELRAVAKARGLKGISSLRKEQLVERMLQEDENDRKKQASEEGTDAGIPQNADTVSDGTADRQSAAGAGSAPDKMAGTERKTSARNAPARTGETADRPEKIKNTENADRTDRTEKTEKTDRNARRPAPKNGGSQQNRPARKTVSRSRTSEREAASSENESAEERYPAARSQPDSRMSAERNSLQQEQLPAEEPAENMKPELQELDSGNEVCGILEVMQDGFGFIRSDNYMPGENDIYVSPSQIRRFGLKTGDMLCGNTRLRTMNEKFSALLYVKSINGLTPAESAKRLNFDSMTPIFPNRRIRLERPGGSLAMRIVDLVSPIGKGQRGMIVSPPKAGKTTLLKDAARSVLRNNPEMHIIILLIDERPEEVTDIRETVHGDNVEVIYSTFDETAEHHKRVSEMAIERARRMVEQKQDVIIFIDSITRLARAYNQVIPASGRTLSGGLDPAALHMPKKFFGAARNMREGGSLTILATALVDTGSKMDDVVYEEFKGTGNMELILDRKLQERRVFPAIDLARSGTRREDLLMTAEELEAVGNMRRALNGLKAEEAGENILNMFAHTRTNRELVEMLRKRRIL